MITVNRFIKDICEEWSKSAKPMLESISVNGVKFEAGCTEKGIHVSEGLDILAKILDKKISKHVESFDTSRFETRYEYIEHNGVWFYNERLVEKELTDEV